MIPEITPQETATWLAQNPQATLIDCREPEETAHCKIDGAMLIPLSQWAANAQAQLPDKSATLVVYCHHGMRSQQAGGFLAQRGYTDVRSMNGGIDRWSVDIDPTIPRY